MKKNIIFLVVFLFSIGVVFAENSGDILDFKIKDKDLEKSVISEAKNNVILSLFAVEQSRDAYINWLQSDENKDLSQEQVISQESIYFDDWVKCVHQFQKDVDFYIDTKKKFTSKRTSSSKRRKRTTKKRKSYTKPRSKSSTKKKK